jgi:hypothetical protein
MAKNKLTPQPDQKAPTSPRRQSASRDHNREHDLLKRDPYRIQKLADRK